jgi:hypothetical protein
MGRKPGIQNIPKGEAQEKVLIQLAQGSTITAAMASVGRNDVTFRQWSMQDADFKDVAKWSGDYVPNDFLCVGDNGYGDYIILTVGADGKIKDWESPSFYDSGWGLC